MSSSGGISGMTGFARAEGAHEGADRVLGWTWEVRSVNGRGLDFKLRLPPGFDALEAPAREAAAKRFKRGSLQAGLVLTRSGGETANVRVDHELAQRLIDAGKKYIEAGEAEAPRWDGILQARGVLVADDVAEIDADARAGLEAALLAGLDEALDRLGEARMNEGRMLAGVLGGLMDRVEAAAAAARANASAAPEAALERLRQRLAALAPDIQGDPQRLAQEAALIAARADVQEELDRLDAHGREVRELLGRGEPVGRRLDFLTQELTREANTLCSKSNDIELTRIGLDLKAAIDQIKEQAANVE